MVRSIPITEDRIRELAYRLWLEDGQPQGKSGKHWQKARELLAHEGAAEEGTEGGAEGYEKAGSWSGMGEERRILDIPGELATTSNRGKQKNPKKRRPVLARNSTKRRPM